MPRQRANLSKRLQNYVVVPRPEKMLLGHSDGSTVEVSPYVVWVTNIYTGIPEKVINRKRLNQWGIRVSVGFDPWGDIPSRKQVLGYADGYLDAAWMGPDVAPHARALHAFGKPDTDFVERERILYYAPVPGENKVDIYPDSKLLPDGSWWWSKTATRADYDSQVPDSGALICAIVIDASGDLAYRTGTPADTIDDLTGASFPILTVGDSVLVILKLYGGMAEAHHLPGNDDFIPVDQSGAYAGTTSGITALHGDVAATGPGDADTTIQPGVVENAMLADETGPGVLGRVSGTGAPSLLSPSDLLDAGLGVFGAIQEAVIQAADGIITHFTFANPAYGILVLADGVVQKQADVTFSAGSSAFDLSWSPATGTFLNIIRLAPVTPFTQVFDKVVLAASQTITSLVDVTDLTMTKTLENGFWYRWKFSVGFPKGSTGTVTFTITDETDNIKETRSTSKTSGYYGVIEFDLTELGTGISVTRKVRAAVDSGDAELTVSAEQSVNFTFERCG